MKAALTDDANDRRGLSIGLLILAVLPAFLAMLMYFVTPTYFRPMLDNFVGLLILGSPRCHHLRQLRAGLGRCQAAAKGPRCTRGLGGGRLLDDLACLRRDRSARTRGSDPDEAYVLMRAALNDRGSWSPRAWPLAGQQAAEVRLHQLAIHGPGQAPGPPAR